MRRALGVAAVIAMFVPGVGAQECPSGFDCSNFTGKVHRADRAAHIADWATITVQVDASKSATDLIREARYLWVDTRTQSIPPPITQPEHAGNVDVILLKFDRPMKTHEVTWEFIQWDLRPIDTRELLSLGIQADQLPERVQNVAALGAIVFHPWISEYATYCIGRKEGEDGWNLLLPWVGFNVEWLDSYYFAAVRRSRR